MNKPRIQRKKILASLIGAAFGAVLMPSAALASEADLVKKIEALQQQIDALTKEMKSTPAATSGGGMIATPAGLELSIYGVGHLSADSIDTGKDSSAYIHSNSSRLGIKGSYELGNGTSAIFQYESGVDLTGHGTGDGNGGPGTPGNLFTRARDSFVGLKGRYGTAVVGRLAGFNQWVYDYNLFGDQVGDLGNIWGQNQPGRLDSAAQYRTPDFNGFSAAVTWDPTGNQSGSSMSNTIVKIDYGKGGLKLGGAYASYGQGKGLSNQEAAAVTGSYEFGAFSLGGGYQWESDIGGVNGADRNSYTLGGTVKVGANGTVKLQYAHADKVDGTPKSDSSQTAIGYDYSWNNQTTLYAAYAQTRNGAANNFQSYDWGHGNQGVPGVVVGQDTSAFSIGVVYKFDMGLIGKR